MSTSSTRARTSLWHRGRRAALLRVRACSTTLPQAALLAGLVQEPVNDDPTQHPSAAKARRNVVLKAMLDEKMIGQRQYRSADATALKAPGSRWPTAAPAPARSTTTARPSSARSRPIPRSRRWAGTPAARLTAISRGGLVIRTTLDPTTQAGAVRAVDAKVPRRDRSGIAAAAVTVEPGTGKVVAMAQNRTYAVTGGRGRTSVNYATDTALGGASGFQTGSSFKPFTLATWLAQGHSLDDVVDATPQAYPFSDFTACGDSLRGTDYSPANSEGTETGPMSVLRATSDSVNTAYVSMESQLDLCDVASTAERLGVHLASPQQECSPSQAATTKLPTCLPSLTLGVATISPLTMAAAYGGFASGGTYCPRFWSRRSVGAPRTVHRARPPCR